MKHFYIATSKIAGMGIMAGEDIKKGDLIRHIKGELKFLSVKNKDDSLSYPNWIGIGEGVWIDPDHPNQYLNHSCNPTAGVKGKVSIVALKDIKEGQEITIDYSTIEGDALWEMPCDCGEKKCRRLIRGIQYLPKKTFDTYMPYVPKYFQRLYNKVNKK
jgi:SET domain-containing protein